MDTGASVLEVREVRAPVGLRRLEVAGPLVEVAVPCEPNINKLVFVSMPEVSFVSGAFDENSRGELTRLEFVCTRFDLWEGALPPAMVLRVLVDFVWVVEPSPVLFILVVLDLLPVVRAPV